MKCVEARNSSDPSLSSAKWPLIWTRPITFNKMWRLVYRLIQNSLNWSLNKCVGSDYCKAILSMNHEKYFKEHRNATCPSTFFILSVSLILLLSQKLPEMQSYEMNPVIYFFYYYYYTGLLSNTYYNHACSADS